MSIPARSRIRNTRRASIVLALVVALASAVAALLVAGASSSAQQRAPEASATLGTNGAPVPKIRWQDCPESVAPQPYQCASASVPLSYRHPNGKTIDLALARLQATDQKRKIGTLFWNPGGPGASGRIPPPFSKELHEHFDIIGFDPRGTNASTPLKCFSSNRQARETFGRPFPAKLEQVNAFFAANKRGTQLCEENAGPVISHMSTANVARDMNLLRQAVGDQKMTYQGYSYGTFLGETYANMFPGKVRAMTLDAVLDPVEWTTGEKPGVGLTQPYTYRLDSFDGAQRALETFFQECASAGPGRCAFTERGAGPDELLARYEGILKRLKQGPVTITEDGQTSELTYQDVVTTTHSALFSAKASPELARFLEDVYGATQAAGQRSAPSTVPEVDVPDVPTRPTFELPEGRAARPANYTGLEWFSGVGCLDTVNSPSPASWLLYARKADERAPGFGSYVTYISMPCATWPAKDPDRYQGPWNKQTANPLLLVGNRRGDPATPYDGARTTATKRLADARLLTLNTFGHGSSYTGLSNCIDAAVDRYLVERKLPPEGKVCQPDEEPFDTP